MALADLNVPAAALTLLQRSLERGRLGHAYLLSGARLVPLETLARNLAKTLNCERPPRRAANGQPLDCCDACPSCRRIDRDQHPDVRWLRPESKLRVILIEQVRHLLDAVYLKASLAPCKVAVFVAADRMNVPAANAFLKTLEEPPPECVFLLLTTEPARVLETIRSRCLPLNLGDSDAVAPEPAEAAWVQEFARQVTEARGGLLARYRLLDQLVRTLTERRAAIETELKNRSPLTQYEEVEPELRAQWEAELKAAIEAEYRRRRGELLAALHLWLRDLWLASQGLARHQLGFPDLEPVTSLVARRLTPSAASRNLQILERTERLLANTNVQEVLALEVGLLRLEL